jgi:hypothetical protein
VPARSAADPGGKPGDLAVDHRVGAAHVAAEVDARPAVEIYARIMELGMAGQLPVAVRTASVLGLKRELGMALELQHVRHRALALMR